MRTDTQEQNYNYTNAADVYFKGRQFVGNVQFDMIISYLSIINLYYSKQIDSVLQNYPPV